MPRKKETLGYLYSLERLGIKPGLKRIQALLREMGGPQTSYPSIHVAGTNGKGSTSAIIESILREAGYKTGLYTSPHLIKFNERIRVAAREITDKELTELTLSAKEALGRTGLKEAPSFFEFTTAIAFEHFKRKGVDIAVIETGMGGRWDATNVLTPLASIITNVNLDHTGYLGKTLREIATEKAGIIKKGGAVITGEDKRAALSVIKKEAKAKNAALFIAGKDFRTETSGDKFDYYGLNEKITGLKVSLRGCHQVGNASVALAAVEVLREKGFRINASHIRHGLKNVAWPGRVEVLGQKPLAIIDAAHNPHGAKALSEALKGFRYKKLVLVMGIMADKDIGGILAPLIPLADTIIFTTPKTERAADFDTLAEMLRPYGKTPILIKSVKDACKAGIKEAGAQGALCVTGSIFTIGEAKSFLSRRKKR